MISILVAVVAVPAIPAMIAFLAKRRDNSNLNWYGDQLVAVAEHERDQDLLASARCEARLIAIKGGN
jgi:hypothetical protein